MPLGLYGRTSSLSISICSAGKFMLISYAIIDVYARRRFHALISGSRRTSLTQTYQQMSFLQSNDNNMFGGTSSQMLCNIFFRHDEGMNWFDEVSGVKGPHNQNYHSEIKWLDTQNDGFF